MEYPSERSRIRERAYRFAKPEIGMVFSWNLRKETRGFSPGVIGGFVFGLDAYFAC